MQDSMRTALYKFYYDLSIILAVVGTLSPAFIQVTRVVGNQQSDKTDVRPPPPPPPVSGDDDLYKHLDHALLLVHASSVLSPSHRVSHSKIFPSYSVLVLACFPLILLAFTNSFSLSFSLSVSHFLSLCLTFSLCPSLFLCLSLSVSLSHFLSVSLSLSLSLFLCLSLSVSLSLSHSLSVCLSLTLVTIV